jgi:hypothetical protein
VAKRSSRFTRAIVAFTRLLERRDVGHERP